MKTKIILILLLIVLGKTGIFSQPCSLPQPIVKYNLPNPAYHNAELLLFNETNYMSNDPHQLRVKIIPVGFLLNGDSVCNPRAVHITANGNVFIAGIDTTIEAGSYLAGNFDENLGGSTKFAFGYGKYKIEFYRFEYNPDPPYQEDWFLKNYVYFDYRDKATRRLGSEYNDTYDMRIDYFNKDTITFHHVPHDSDFVNYSNSYWHIDLVNKDIKMWNLFGTCLEPLVPNKALFSSDASENGAYLKWPINANKYNGYIGHENSGDLGMNILVNHNITTRDTLIDTITNINITNKSVLSVSANKTFDLITPVSPPIGRTNVTVEDSSGLSLLTDSKIIIRDRTKLTLRQNSFVKSYPGSEITVHAGGTFCNEGSEIVGPLRIRYLSGIFPICAVTSSFEIKDSLKIILSDSAVLELPDDFTLHISGKESSLILNPHSKIKFGENSKIRIDSSATLIANGATFTSVDSTLKWDGILLSDTDADTITNCTFSNAVNALTITNNANSAYKNRIITNNAFNIPNGGIHKGIYGENNYKILLKGNTFNMPVYFSSSSPVPLVYIGVYLKNSSTIEAAGGDIDENQSINYSLNINENTL